MEDRVYSKLDTDQIIKKEYDAQSQAKRVVIVGGEKLELSVDNASLVEAVKEGLRDAKLELPKEKEIQIVEVPKPFAVAPEVRIQIVEVPKIVIQKEVQKIEVPYLITRQEIQVVEIEKPIVIKETDIQMVEKPILINKDTTFNIVVKVLEILLLTGIVINQLIKH